MSALAPSRRPACPLRGPASARGGRLRLGIVLALLGGGLALPRQAAAAPDEEWSLSRERDDPRLVEQRLAKLHRTPFDRRQWRALVGAIGLRELGRRLDARLARAPRDVAWGILRARADLAAGRATSAAERLQALLPRAGRHEARAFALWVDALVAAGRADRAVEALSARAAGSSKAQALRLWAYRVAKRANLAEAALEQAQALERGAPADAEASLRVAQAARAAGRADEALAAYDRAVTRAFPRRRAAIRLEQARAALALGAPDRAAALAWSALADPRAGSTTGRAPWWDVLLRAHRAAGSTQELVARLTPWLAGERARDEAAAWRTLARAQEAEGMDPGAAWARAVELSPRDAQARAALVRGLMARDDLEAAAAAWRSGGRSETELETGLALAQRALETGRRDLGLALAAEVRARGGRRAGVLLALVDFYNAQLLPEKALEVIQDLVRTHPRDPDARVALGEQLYEMGRAADALEQWASLTKLVRPRHAGLARHAQVLSEHGRTFEAIKQLQAALALAPEEPAYHRLMALLQEQHGRPSRALGHWHEVRRLATRPEQVALRAEARTRIVELLVNGRLRDGSRRAKIRAEIERADRALSAGEPLDEAMEAGRLLAELYVRQGRFDEAVAVRRQVLDLAPGDAEAAEALATTLRRAHRPEQARKVLEELLARAPERRGRVLEQLSELALAEGDPDDALRYATLAARRDRARADALLRLGELHRGRGEPEAAARAYAQALELAPNAHAARVALADIYLAQGQAARARQALAPVLARAQDPAILREAGRRALDLAQLDGDDAHAFDPLLDLASRRAAAGGAGAPADLLLDVLARAPAPKVRAWIDAAPGHAERIRAALLALLARGSVRARARAADHLGELALPDTGPRLAATARTLAPPRGATRTTARAYRRAQLAALAAAGKIGDPRAAEDLWALLVQAGQTRSADVVEVAAWSLLALDSPLARSTLAALLHPGGPARAAKALGQPVLVNLPDPARFPALRPLACAVVARDPSAVDRERLSLALGALTARGSPPITRTICGLARALARPDAEGEVLLPDLTAADPARAALAAARLARTTAPSPAELVALLRLYLGPSGLARDAAGAALAALLGPEDAPDLVHPGAPEGPGWHVDLEGWLHHGLAPPISPLPPERASALRPLARRALAAIRDQGTRAERAAAMTRTCAGPGGRPALCLSPLLARPLTLRGD